VTAPRGQGDLAATYDKVADEYARRLADELERKPFDRLMLDQFAEKIGAGPVADLGCGPGHVGRYLYDRGATGVFGVDLSPRMVQVASAQNPGMRFEVGDMHGLPLGEASLDGIVAFYAIVHVPTHALARPLLEMARVVRVGGWLLLAFHVGHEVKRLDEWWGMDVDVTFHFHNRFAVAALLRETGWRVRDAMERSPYGEDVEHPSRRAYLLAQRV
jgi:SAM-dependent methyltransferase